MAFTTDQTRPELGWIVRYHPDHGRSVLLVRDEDASAMHSVLAYEAPQALLFRSGGYWWDGTTWHRPAQLWDWAEEEYFRRAVPSAVTVIAEDLLQEGGDAEHGRVLTIDEVDLATPYSRRWLDDLALWAEQREGRGHGEHVVRLSAPELTADSLIGVASMAELAGIAPSTLRSYIARRENDVPAPQATVGRSDLWAAPVAAEWVEARNRSSDGAASAVAIDRNGSSLPPGVAELWTRFSSAFMSLMWERPDRRKRWAMRWRTEAAVRDIAEDLSWSVAADMDTIVPIHDLAFVLEHAVLDDLAESLKLESRTQIDWSEVSDSSTDRQLTKADWYSFGLNFRIAKMLDWLIRHKPDVAHHTLPSIVGRAQDRFGIPRQVTERTLATALSLDGKLDSDSREDFLRRVFAPQDGPQPDAPDLDDLNL